MIIGHNHTENKGEFFIADDQGKQAQITYSKAGADKIIIDHTEVDETLRGQGIGYKLVERAVEHAREQGLKIMPLCPFAKAVFKKNQEYQDVLY